MVEKYLRYGILVLSLLILTTVFSLADSTDLLNLEDEKIVEALRGKIDIATHVLGEDLKKWLI